MFIDNSEMDFYPFEGQFRRCFVDESKPLDEQSEENVVVLRTRCDIMEAGKSHSRSKNFISASFVVYFPIDKDNPEVVVKRGDTFHGDVYGMPADGKVIGVFPSQLKACLVYIEDLDI